MSSQAGRLKGKRKRKRAKAMERCIVTVQELNVQNVPKTMMSYRVAVANLFKCITSTQIAGLSTSKAPPISTINRWTEEKLKYYNLPYLLQIRGIAATNEYAVDIQFIGAMDRQDDLIHVLHI